MGETESFAGDAVTVLFTDVEGSAELRNRLGDDAAHELLASHEELVRKQVSDHGGREVKTIGDGFMVAFSSAPSAVACAVGIQRALEDLEGADRNVRIRIGLNTGDVIRRAGDLFGRAVDAAARVAAKAKGGQILVSPSVAQLAAEASGVAFVDRGLFWLKGFPERWRLYEASWRAESSVPAPSPEHARFVGRDRERADLRRLLDQAASGRGALVMVGGEPGVGKTRLAQEIASEAEDRGMRVLVGHCYEMEGAPPYIPFIEILESAVARAASLEGFREALGESASEVARLVPEVRRLFLDIPPPLELPPEQERRYLLNSIRDFVERAAQIRPIALVLDDLHWADEPSLLLLRHIAERLADMPVLVVGTYRDVELDVERPLAKTLEELLRARLAHRLALRRLPQDAVSEMLAALADQPEPPRALVDAVYSETEGNPFFVEEVFRHLSEEGRLFDASGRWRGDLEIDELDVPEGVRLVIGRRLQRLSEECRKVLTSAAVIGRGFGFDLLEALGGLDPDALLDAVDEAERARLIASSAAGPEARFTFAHELIRQTLLGSLSLPRRQRLHLKVADAIERTRARALGEHVADVAHHLYQAGAAADPERTARFLVLAGDRAMQAAAFEDALRWYEDAASVQPAEDLRGRADLLVKLGFARRSLGRFEEAIKTWREALDALADLGDAAEVGRVCVDASQQLGWAARWVEATEMVQRGLLALGQQETPERARLLSFGGALISWVGAYRPGDEMTDEALELARRIGDEGLLGLALQGKSLHHYAFMELERVAETGLEAADLLRRSGNLWDLATGLPFVEFAHSVMGRWDELARIDEEVAPLAQRLGNYGAILLSNRARRWSGYEPFDLDTYERFGTEDLEMNQATGLPWGAQALGWLGVVEFWRGRWDRALELFRRGADEEPFGALKNFMWGLFLRHHAYLGDRETFFAELKARSGEYPRLGEPNTWGSWSMPAFAAEGFFLLGERERAAETYPFLAAPVEHGAMIRSIDLRLSQTLLGIAAAAGERWDVADEHYRRALEQADQYRLEVECADVRRFYGQMLLERGGLGERGRELLAEASDRYRRIGMPRHIEMAETLLAGA